MLDSHGNEVSPFDFDLAMARRASRMEDIKSPAGRRLHLCRDITYGIVTTLEALPDSKNKNELINMAKLLLRMALVENDGAELSPSKLNGF